MKALMSPLARSIFRNPANKGALSDIMQNAGFGPENAVHVTVTPMNKDGTTQPPVRVAAYAVLSARLK